MCSGYHIWCPCGTSTASVCRACQSISRRTKCIRACCRFRTSQRGIGRFGLRRFKSPRYSRRYNSSQRSQTNRHNGYTTQSLRHYLRHGLCMCRRTNSIWWRYRARLNPQSPDITARISFRPQTAPKRSPSHLCSRADHYSRHDGSRCRSGGYGYGHLRPMCSFNPTEKSDGKSLRHSGFRSHARANSRNIATRTNRCANSPRCYDGYILVHAL